MCQIKTSILSARQKYCTSAFVKSQGATEDADYVLQKKYNILGIK